jgi:hypothetical protein
MHIRKRVLVGGAAVIASLVVGCGNSESAAPAGPTHTETSLPSPVAEKAAAEKPAQTTGTGECKVADLTLSLKGHGVAGGTGYSALIFTNKGTRTCTMQGFPGVSYVAGDDGHQVGAAAYRTGDKGPVITLRPGDSAFAQVGFSSIGAYDAAACNPTEVRGLRIYPPHEYDSMYLPHPATGCANIPPDNQLSVATVQAGTGD